MADITDNFGRVNNFGQADMESLKKMLMSAVGDAVRYLSDKKQTIDNTADTKKLIDAMEELGDNVKENIESMEDLVKEVEKVSKVLEQKKTSGGSGRSVEDFSRFHKEQMSVLNQILKSQQRAQSEKIAKFTTGGTAVSRASKTASAKDVGFVAKGADRVPAMLRKNEVIVTPEKAAKNPVAMNAILRGEKIPGFSRGGKVKPAYMAGGTDGGGPIGTGTIDVGAFISPRVKPTLDPKLSNEDMQGSLEMGQKAADNVNRGFSATIKKKLSGWATSFSEMLLGGEKDFLSNIFNRTVIDAVFIRAEMRKLAFQLEGINKTTRGMQESFGDMGTSIKETGKRLEMVQKAYLKNASKGFKDQKAGLKVLKSGLYLSTMIGAEGEQTADLFADWHRSLGMSETQMGRMADEMRNVALNTGVTGDALVDVMKSSEDILRSLRNQANLTTSAARNVVEVMANAKKLGIEDTAGRIMKAMSSTNELLFNASNETRSFVFSMASRMEASGNKGAVQRATSGVLTKNRSDMGGVADEMLKTANEYLKHTGIQLGSLSEIEDLTDDQKGILTQELRWTGLELGEYMRFGESLENSRKTLAEKLQEYDKQIGNANATEEEQRLAIQKRNRFVLDSSMGLLSGLREQAGKEGASMADAAQKAYAKMSKDEKSDLAQLGQTLDASTQRMLGIQGKDSQAIQALIESDPQKGFQIAGIAAAQKLSAAAKDQNKPMRDFAKELKEARGDNKKFREVYADMEKASKELGIDMATSVDPTTDLAQKMGKLNETIRKFFSGPLGLLLDTLGGTGLLLAQVGLSMGSIGVPLADAIWKAKDFIAKPLKAVGTIMSKVGNKSLSVYGDLVPLLKDNKMFEPFLKAFAKNYWKGGSALQATIKGLGAQISSFGSIEVLGTTIGGALRAAIGPAVLLLGAIKGISEHAEAGRTKTEGAILGALTGGAKTGSFLSPTLGIKKGSAADKTLGVVGGAAWGAMAGAAIGTSLAPFTAGLSIPAAAALGAVVGGLMEIVKIITEGTDILQDIFGPIQVVVDYVWGALGDIWKIIKSIVTLDIGGVISGVFSLLSRTIFDFFRLIFSTIKSVIIGLPKLIFKALSMIWQIPKMVADSIKATLAGLVDNAWVGPIFKTLSDAFNAIYDGFMAIWTPISEIFSGIYTVFDDLGKALFGAGSGGGVLAGVIWVLQKAVWSLSYVISWLLSPLILLAKALGFVLKIVGGLIKGIIAPFQWLYNELVGHSIVPDLVTGIISWFARLPIYIFKGLLKVPMLILKAFKKVPASIFSGMKLIYYELPRWLMTMLVSGLGYMGSFFMLTLPKILWNAFTGALKTVGKFIYDVITYPFRKLGEWLKAIFIDFPIWLYNKFIGIFTNSGTYIKGALIGIVTWFGSSLMGGLTGFISTITGFFTGLPGLITGGFTSALGGVWKWISGWMPSFGGIKEKVVGAGGAVLDYGKKLIPNIKEQASKAFEKLGSVGTTIKGYASTAFEKGKGAFSYLTDKSKEVFGSGKGMFSSLFEKGKGAFSYLTDKGKEMFGSGKGMFSSLFEKGKGAFSSISDKATKMFSGASFSSIAEKGKGIFSKIASTGSGLFGKVDGSVMKGFFSKAMNAGAGLFGKAGGATKGFFSKAMTAGAGLFGKTGGATKGFFSKAMSMGAGLLGKTSGAKGFLSKAMSAGSGLLGKVGGAEGLFSKAQAFMGGDYQGLIDSILGGGEKAEGGGGAEDCSCALAQKSEEQASLLSGVQDMLTPENFQKGLDFGKEWLAKSKDVLGNMFSKSKDMFGNMFGKSKDMIGGLFGKGKDLFGAMLDKGKGIFSSLTGGAGGKGIFGSLMGKAGDLLGGGKGLFGGIAGKVSGMFAKGGGLLGGLFGGGGIAKAAGGMFSKGAGLMGSMFGSAGGMMAKMGMGGLGKGLLKKIPGVGALAGAGFAIADLVKGDIGGALTNLASGIAGAIPGIGPVLSAGIDMFGGTIAKGAGWLASKAWDGAKGLGSAVGGLASKAWEGAKGLGSAVGGLVSKAWQGAKGLGSAVGGLASKAWEGAKSLGSSLVGGGKGLFGGIAGKVSGMFSKGGGLLGGLFGGGGIAKAAGGIFSKGAGLMGSMFGSAGGMMAKMGMGGLGKSLLKKIPGVGALAGAGFAIADLVKGDVGGALTNLASGIAGAIPGIGPVLSAGIDMFGGTISKGAGWLASKAWQGAKGLGSAVKGLASKAWEGAKNLGKAVLGKGGLSKAWKGMKSMFSYTPTGMLMKAFSGKGSLASKAWKGMKSMFLYTPTGMLMKAFSSGKGLIGGLFGKGASIGSKIMSTIKGSAGLVGNLFGKAGSFLTKAGLGGAGKSLLKKLPGIGAVAGAGFALASLIKGDVGGALTHLASGIAGSIPLIGPVLSFGIDTFGKKLYKGAGWIWNGVKSLSDKLTEGGSWLYDGVKNWFGNAWKGAKNWWNSLWGGKEQNAANAAMTTNENRTTTVATPVGASPAVATATKPGAGVASVQPVHLRDISQSILRDRAGSGGSKLHSDELTRMEESSKKQITELEQIKQGIKELVAILKPKGGDMAYSSNDNPALSTRDPRRPRHAARFGKMKYGKVGGNANRSLINNGEV